MIIKRMCATFGCLDHAELTPQDGLNVICAPNESGKSTWCAFLRAMFYGFPTRERDTKDALSDKNHYRPWNGAPMEGEIDLIHGGRAITLRRFSRGSTPFGGFEAMDTLTGAPIPELTAQNCGQTLLGVGREVWERSAFLGCVSTPNVGTTPELERRISAIFSSADENVSYSQTLDLLKKRRNLRRHNQTGKIPVLEREIAEMDDLIARMQDANGRMARAQADRLALERERAAAERDVNAYEALARQSLNDRYARALAQERELRQTLSSLERERDRFGQLPSRAALTDAQAMAQRLTAAEDELSRARNEARTAAQTAAQAEGQAADPRFPSPDAAEDQAQRHRTECLALDRRARSMRRGRIFVWLLTLLGCAPLPFLSRLPLPAAVGIPAVCAACSLVLFLLLGRAARRLDGQSAAILSRYGARTPDDIPAAARDFRRRVDEARFARREADRAADACAERETRLTASRAELLCFVRSFSPDVSDVLSCTDAIDRALRLADRLDTARAQLSTAAGRCDDLRAQGAREEAVSDLPPVPARAKQQAQDDLKLIVSDLALADSRQDVARGELASLGDPAELASRREQAAKQLDLLRLEYDAFSVAIEALEEANTALQSRFAPELNRLSGEIMGKLTAHRYDAVRLDRDLNASATASGGTTPRSWLSLSRGTADQLYLSVRLALCRLCLPEDDPSPLVLDDALLAFDDERERLALAYLADTDRQILFFSCQDRDRRAGFGHILSLQS